jgi:hypothetical protein
MLNIFNKLRSKNSQVHTKNSSTKSFTKAIKAAVFGVLFSHGAAYADTQKEVVSYENDFQS